MNQKPTLVVIIATVVSALLQFLNWTPDPSVATDIVQYGDQLKDSIQARNWANTLTAIIGIGTLVYLWLTGRLRAKPSSTAIIALALMATALAVLKPSAIRRANAPLTLDVSTAPTLKIEIIKPLPRLFPT